MMAIHFEKRRGQGTRILVATPTKRDERDDRNTIDAMAEKMRELGFSGEGASEETLKQAGFSALQIKLFSHRAVQVATARAIKRL